ncbi:MAG: hypothetical protein NW216_13190 [Hyphomicrobium sp.]|nr:hypothetical protein [Hyphomicrobium sp.]
MPASAPKTQTSLGRVGTWLTREAIALTGVVGTSLTVLAQVAGAIPMVPAIADLLQFWRETTAIAIEPPFRLVGIEPHPHIAAALAYAVFVAMIGLGANVANRLSGGPPFDPHWQMLEGATWPSGIAFAAMLTAFIFGHDPTSESKALLIMGSEDAGKYAFALIATAGYIVGDALGQRVFHARLLRTAALTLAVIGINQVLMSWPGA